MHSRYKNAFSLLATTAFLITFFLIPSYYSDRLSTGIFRFDFYMIWITGCLCWLSSLLFFPIRLTRLGIMCSVGILYILSLYLYSSYFDENSTYLLISLLSLIGIIAHFSIGLSAKCLLLALFVICTSYFYQVIIGIWQAIESKGYSLSIKGQLYNSGFYGNYLASMAPMFFSAALHKSKLTLLFRLSILLGLLIILILLYLTLARAAIIGTILGCLTILLYQLKNSRLKRFFTYGSLFLMMPLLAIASYYIKPASASGRLTIYEISLQVFRDHPLFGIGPNRYSAVYNNYQSEHFKTGNHPIPKQLVADNTLEAFNSIIQVVVEYGIIGFLILLAITYQLFNRQITSLKAEGHSWWKKGSIGGIVAIVVCSLFSNPFHVAPILMIFAFHLIVVLSKEGSVHPKSPGSFLILLCSIMALGISYYIMRQVKGEYLWEKAAYEAKYVSFKSAEPYYEDAFNILRFNGDFQFNYGAEASLAGESYTAIRLLENAKKYNAFSNLFVYLGDAYLDAKEFSLAEQNYLHAIHIAPSHIYPKYQLIQFYKKCNKSKEAKIWTTRTLRFPVKLSSDVNNELLNELRQDSSIR